MPAEMVATLGNAASLQRLWAGVLASLKRAKAAYGVLFMNTRAVFDGQALIVEFPAENDFAFKAVQKPDVQQELAAALRHEARCDIPFELRKAGAGAASFAALAAAAPSAGGVAQPNPVAAAAARAAAQVAAPPRPTAPASVPSPSSAPAPTPAPTPASSGSSAPAAAPVPALVAEELPPWETAPAAPVAPPDDDRPPYDDYVPYDDADIPFEEPPSAPSALATAPAASPSSPVASSAPSVPPAASVSVPGGADAGAVSSGLPPEPDTVSGPSPNPPSEPNDAELNASLAFGFGDGIAFEEVS